LKEVYAKRGRGLLLGRQGEHLARCIVFDIRDWQALYGEGSVHLLAQRSGEEVPYPCAVTVVDGMALWVVRAADVAVAGRGKAELQYRVGDTVVKSELYGTEIRSAMGEAGPVPPEPQQSWVERVLQSADAAAQSAKDAREAVVQTVAIGETGNWQIDGEDTGVSAIGPRGEPGQPGERGETGYPIRVGLSGSVQDLVLANNIDYCCTDPVTTLRITGFEADSDGRSEVWGIHFAAGETITVTLPASVVWNWGAAPVFTPGSEYWLLFTPLLNGRVLGIWNEVEA